MPTSLSLSPCSHLLLDHGGHVRSVIVVETAAELARRDQRLSCGADGRPHTFEICCAARPAGATTVELFLQALRHGGICFFLGVADKIRAGWSLTGRACFSNVVVIVVAAANHVRVLVIAVDLNRFVLATGTARPGVVGHRRGH